MAELVWKGKHTQGQCHPMATHAPRLPSTAMQPQLRTNEHYMPHQEADTALQVDQRWQNRLIWGDNNTILPLLAEEFTSTINLMYIDPPFMTGRTFRTDAYLAYSDTWRNNLDAYLQWLYDILTHLYTLLAPDGSLYIHLDWRAIHYAKIMLDEIFGSSMNGHGPGFKNEIIWHYQSGGRAQKHYARKHDTLLLYTKSGDYCFHGERVSPRRGTQKRNHMRKEIGADGRIAWTIRSSGRTYTYDEDATMALADVWCDISHLHQRDPERTGYATQKPEALLERILLASSEEHDLVLDCFCGSGVTPVVAERLGRRWIACDKSEAAISVTRKRVLERGHSYPFTLQKTGPESPRDVSEG